jgi:hypothetical protein
MDTFILGLILIALAGLACWGIVYIAYKRTFVFAIGSIFLAVMDAIACFAFTVGQKGLIHLTWAVPIAIILILTSYTILSKRIKEPIQH